MGYIHKDMGEYGELSHHDMARFVIEDAVRSAANFDDVTALAEDMDYEFTYKDTDAVLEILQARRWEIGFEWELRKLRELRHELQRAADGGRGLSADELHDLLTGGKVAA